MGFHGLPCHEVLECWSPLWSHELRPVFAVVVVVGFGRFRRICLFDTLLPLMSEASSVWRHDVYMTTWCLHDLFNFFLFYFVIFCNRGKKYLVCNVPVIVGCDVEGDPQLKLLICGTANARAKFWQCWATKSATIGSTMFTQCCFSAIRSASNCSFGVLNM